MTAPIPAGLRADLDRELEQAVQALLGKAAGYDGMDLIEANTELTNDFYSSPLDRGALAASVAMLALRLHRGGGT
jgi:hypothetical protein